MRVNLADASIHCYYPIAIGANYPSDADDPDTDSACHVTGVVGDGAAIRRARRKVLRRCND